MRIRARVDDNQKQIVDELRKRGFAVLHLHMVGRGCPDLLVSDAHDMRLVEVKMTEKSKYKPLQIKFNAEWKGLPALRVHSVENFLQQWEDLAYGIVEDKC